MSRPHRRRAMLSDSSAFYCPALPSAPAVDDGLLTLQQAAAEAGVTSRTVLRWVERGRLRAFVDDGQGRKLYLVSAVQKASS